MPNIKNAKKAVLVQAKKNNMNNTYRANTKTALKNVEKAIISKDKKAAEAALVEAIKRLDKACAKKVVTANFVARNKSRLTKKVNEMK